MILVVSAALRDVLADNKLLDVLSAKRDQIMALDPRPGERTDEGIGVAIEDVRIRRADLPEENTKGAQDVVVVGLDQIDRRRPTTHHSAGRRLKESVEQPVHLAQLASRLPSNQCHLTLRCRVEIVVVAIMKSEASHVKSYYMQEHSFGQPATKRAASVSSSAQSRGPTTSHSCEDRLLRNVRRAQRCQRPKPPRHGIEWTLPRPPLENRGAAATRR